MHLESCETKTDGENLVAGGLRESKEGGGERRNISSKKVGKLDTKGKRPKYSYMHHLWPFSSELKTSMEALSTYVEGCPKASLFLPSVRSAAQGCTKAGLSSNSGLFRCHWDL